MTKNFRIFQSQCHMKEKLVPRMWKFADQVWQRSRGCHIDIVRSYGYVQNKEHSALFNRLDQCLLKQVFFPSFKLRSHKNPKCYLNCWFHLSFTSHPNFIIHFLQDKHFIYKLSGFWPSYAIFVRTTLTLCHLVWPSTSWYLVNLSTLLSKNV